MHLPFRFVGILNIFFIARTRRPSETKGNKQTLSLTPIKAPEVLPTRALTAVSVKTFSSQRPIIDQTHCQHPKFLIDITP